MVTFDIISIFPDSLSPYVKSSILGRAIKKKLIKVNLVNLRDFASGKHRIVDDAPYGGGPGMVLKADVIFRAVKKSLGRKKRKTRVILFSTRGKKFDAKMARKFSAYEKLVLISGRYEGVDERVAKFCADEEISIGDYVLSGGELPSLVFLEAVSRQIPGVLGKEESLEEKKGSYPVYTRPSSFTVLLGGKKKKFDVPGVLLHGNHKEIDEWRKTQGRL